MSVLKPAGSKMHNILLAVSERTTVSCFDRSQSDLESAERADAELDVQASCDWISDRLGHLVFL